MKDRVPAVSARTHAESNNDEVVKHKLPQKCGVASCYKQKGVDFCLQCRDIPCKNTNFNPNLHQRWVKMIRLMKEAGVETY